MHKSKEKKQMVRKENECCDCAAPGYPCMGNSCPNRNVTRCYCDKCDSEISQDEVYCYDGMDLCEDCLKDMCKKEW